MCQGLEPAESALGKRLDVVVLNEPGMGADSDGAIPRSPPPSLSPCPRVTHRYCRCESPAKALSPISVNLLELRRLQRERGEASAPGWAGRTPRGAPGCPAGGTGDLQELQGGDVGESRLPDLREGCVHHGPAGETELQQRGRRQRGAATPGPPSSSSVSPAVTPAGARAAHEGRWDVAQGPQQPPCPVWGHGGDKLQGAGTHAGLPTPCGSPWPGAMCTRTCVNTREGVCKHTHTGVNTHSCHTPPCQAPGNSCVPRDPPPGPLTPQPCPSLGLRSPRSHPCPHGVLVPKVAAGTGGSAAVSGTDGWLRVPAPQDTGTGPGLSPGFSLPQRPPH